MKKITLLMLLIVVLSGISNHLFANSLPGNGLPSNLAYTSESFFVNPLVSKGKIMNNGTYFFTYQALPLTGGGYSVGIYLNLEVNGYYDFNRVAPVDIDIQTPFGLVRFYGGSSSLVIPYVPLPSPTSTYSILTSPNHIGWPISTTIYPL